MNEYKIELDTYSTICKPLHNYNSLLQLITDYLLKIGFQNTLKGFIYIREAIMLRMQNHVVNTTNNDIYKIIAKNHNIKPGSVQKAILFSIEKAQYQCNLNQKNDLFKNKFVLSNSEFIAEVAESITLSFKGKK